jgi:hypothetical protein
LNAAIVVRIHEGERRCSSAEERRSHTAKGGCSNQPTGTNFESELIPAVVQWSERLNVNQVTHVRFVPQGPLNGGVAQRKSGGLQNRVSAGSIPASPAILLHADGSARGAKQPFEALAKKGGTPAPEIWTFTGLPFTDFFR